MYSELYLYEYHLHIHTCWWVTGYMTQSARIQSAKSDLQGCLLFFLEVKVMKLRCRLTWPYGYPGIWSTFYLIFSKPFSGHVTLDLVPSKFFSAIFNEFHIISWPPTVNVSIPIEAMSLMVWTVFSGNGWFGRWPYAYCDFEDLRADIQMHAKETKVSRKSPWLLGCGIFEKWPTRSTCKWKKHDQCNRSMGFDWHVNVISGF